MSISIQNFLPVYVTFLLIAIVERIISTFYQKEIKKTQSIHYRWSFVVLFYTYIFIVLFSIAEYLFEIKAVVTMITMLGLSVYVLGVLLRRSAIKALGDNWSVYIEIKNRHVLIKDGIYKRIKHPYCLAVIFELAGICLISNSYIALLFVFFAQFPLLLIRIHLEEKVLLKHFGNSYKY